MSEKTLSIKKRGLNFEMFMWMITRLTALAMYALLLAAVIGALIMGARMQMNLADVMRWSFMPNPSHVQSTNVPDLAPWSSIFWRLLASVFLFIAAAHGTHGLVVIADDYIVTPRGRNTARVLSIILLLTMTAMGLYILWTQ